MTDSNSQTGLGNKGNSPIGRDGAIRCALNWTEGYSFSDGNMTVGVSDDHVAISFKNTPHMQNTLVVLRAKDASTLQALLYSAKSEGVL